MRPDNPSPTTSCPSSVPDAQAQSSAMAWGWILALVILMVSTSLAVASVSLWLVPPYFILMTWLLYPGQDRRATASVEPGTEPAVESATAERPEPNDVEIDLRSSAESDLLVPPLSADSDVRQEAAPEPAPVKTKRGKGRGRKAKGAVVVEPPAGATWIRVGPGKFVRADGPSPTESSLATPEGVPIAPTLSDDTALPSELASDAPLLVEAHVPAEILIPEVIEAPAEDFAEGFTESPAGLFEDGGAPVESFEKASAELVESLPEEISEPVEDLSEVAGELEENLSETIAEPPVFDETEAEAFEQPSWDEPPASLVDEVLPPSTMEEEVEGTSDVDLPPTFESHHDDRSAEDANHGMWLDSNPGEGTVEDVEDAADTVDDFTAYDEVEAPEIDEQDVATRDQDIASEAFEDAPAFDEEAHTFEEVDEDRLEPEASPSLSSRSSFTLSPASWRGVGSHVEAMAGWAPSDASSGRLSRSGRQVRIAPGFRRHSKRSLGRFRQVCRTFPPRSPPARGSCGIRPGEPRPISASLPGRTLYVFGNLLASPFSSLASPFISSLLSRLIPSAT